ncbi:MAG: DNA polymerase III subunit delta [Woeseiaceae bacterium]|nr:DNA polymerase III subunit delta [Woeseiaceae bacterium]
MKIPANQLSAQLDKSLLPCYLVTGDEPLLVQEALDAIRAAARRREFSSRDLFVAVSGFDWAELAAAGSNQSLFAERRIIELQLPTGKPGRQGAAAICDLLPRLAADLLLIVSAPKLDRSAATSKWARALESAGGLVPVWPIDRRELPAWIQARMRAIGLAPDRDAVRLLAERVEGNLLAAQQEIEKLRLLQGEGPVSVEEVSRAVADSSRFDVYKLVDAALAGDARRALRILGGVRAEGVQAAMVMWALAREVRTLARLAENVGAGRDLGAAMQKSGVWRNRQALVRSCVGRHGRADFYRLLQALRQADAAAKGQQAGDPWLLASEIILLLARGRPQAA